MKCHSCRDGVMSEAACHEEYQYRDHREVVAFDALRCNVCDEYMILGSQLDDYFKKFADLRSKIDKMIESDLLLAHS